MCTREDLQPYDVQTQPSDEDQAPPCEPHEPSSHDRAPPSGGHSLLVMANAHSRLVTLPTHIR